jgi:phosphoribosylglycinamide formyltransferase-1
MKRLAIFASGNGSNAQRIIEYFNHHPHIRPDIVLSNNPRAGVLQRAGTLGVPAVVFTRHEFYDTGYVTDLLAVQNVSHLILAGFLWLVPAPLLHAYAGRIINIHPALLPAYGGKGMYGMKVHQAVIAAGETESGITIHYVNEQYDAGEIIFQARCPVMASDTPETLASRIHELEYRHFPEVIEKVVNGELVNW